MGDYKILKHLGDGGFASVNLIHHSTFGKVAYKKLGATRLPDSDLIRLKQEAGIHLRIRHPNIVSMFEAQFTSPDIGLFLEYMPYGSVDTFIREYTVTWEWKTQILYDVSLAMTYLHQQKPVIIHGDLKSQNILIGDGYRAKISDFGLSCVMQTFTSEFDDKLSGTVEYIAPEYLAGQKSTKTEKFDVYGFAISAWEVFSEKSFSKVFFDRKLISVQVPNGTRPRVTDMGEGVPTRVVEMIEKCWQQSSAERPTFETIRDVLLSQLVANQFQLKLPRMKKSSRHSLEESHQGPSDRTDFETSVDDERSVSRAKHKFMSGYKQVVDSLVEYLDSNDSFLTRLKQRGLLCDQEYEQLSAIPMSDSNYCVARNKKLLTEYLSQRIEHYCMEFIEALKDNDQEHIVNLIMNAGEHLDRVLSKEEIQTIDDNMSCLVNLIDLYKTGFLDLLVAAKCITGEHRDLIELCENKQKRNLALLTIMKRKGYRHYSNFKLGLSQTKQDCIRCILTGGQTFVVRAIAESNFADLVKNNLTGNVELVETATMEPRKVEELKSSGIEWSGSHCDDSNDECVIVSYLLCTTHPSIVTLRQMYETGKLCEIVENIYCSKLGMPQSKLIKTLKLDLTGFCSETSKELKRQHFLNGMSHYIHCHNP